MPFDSLRPYGWNQHWATLLQALPGDALPGRVLRHDGIALLVVTPEGIITSYLSARLEPEPTVGDWVALEGGHPVAVLPRSSLLRRRAVRRDAEQALAANIDVALLVCGLDRPVKTNRIRRTATLATDAGARPVIVLTKALLADDADAMIQAVRDANPGIEVLVTSVREGMGVAELRAVSRHMTVALLGESGAGKSSIVNALLDEEAAAVGAVRRGDAKGRHTTTTRWLHLLPGGGAMIDSPGIRSVGMWTDREVVTETFADIASLGDDCRFRDCAHDQEPGCAVKAAVTAGTLSQERVALWRVLGEETDEVAEQVASTRGPTTARRRRR